MGEVHHETIYFLGRVQGVGFRYSTMQVAREFDVTGFVRNLPDGRVHLEVEGSSSDVEAFLAMIQERMHGLIRKVERHPGRGTPRFSTFDIR